MGDVLLITVQGGEQKDGWSTADQAGLTDFLGYRPYFCTLVDEDSLSETWFRLWAASPRCPEEIICFSIPEEDCIPINLLDWSNNCLCMSPKQDEIRDCLNKNLPHATDYLVKEIPEDALRLPVAALYQSSSVLESLLKDIYDAPEYVVTYAKESHTIFLERTRALLETDSFCYGKSRAKEDVAFAYWAIRMSGIIPFLWAILAKKDAQPGLLAINAADFIGTPAYIRAQDILMEWDNRISNNSPFTIEEYQEMRSQFISALDILANKHTELIAKAKGIGRNDKCFCGSGKKFKQCHANRPMDVLVNLN